MADVTTRSSAPLVVATASARRRADRLLATGHLAEAVASAVPDVRRVVNNVRVAPSEAPAAGEGRTLGENLDDKALVAKVHLAFSLHRDLKGTDLDVRVYRKEVTLGGEVDSPSQKALAVKLAQETTGVAAVKLPVPLPMSTLTVALLRFETRASR